MHLPSPVLCALDTQEVATAAHLTHTLRPHVGGVKLGLEFFTRNGAAGVEEIGRAGVPIFLDLKFHDIPNTVSKAIRATAGLPIFMLTVHTSGGIPMLRAAKEAADAIAQRTGNPPPMIIGVTILTSMDEVDVASIGFPCTVEEQVIRLADLAVQSGIDGVVCSPMEIAPIRAATGTALKLIVPGIRPAGAALGDQKRVLSPREALAAGADYLVIGRPITEATDPAEAARLIAESL